MLLLRAFLRNLSVVLVIGSVGVLALRLPFSPWITVPLYAAAVAALLTWGECVPPPKSRPKRGRPRETRQPNQPRSRARSKVGLPSS